MIDSICLVFIWSTIIPYFLSTGIKDQSRDANTSFVDLGMDSLINIEIKVILETDFNINLSSKEIEKLTLNKLQLMADGNVSNNNQEETEQKKVDKITAHMMKEYLEIPIPTKIITKLNDIVSGVPLFIVHHLYGTTNFIKQLHSGYLVFEVNIWARLFKTNDVVS